MRSAIRIRRSLLSSGRARRCSHVARGFGQSVVAKIVWISRTRILGGLHDVIRLAGGDVVESDPSRMTDRLEVIEHRVEVVVQDHVLTGDAVTVDFHEDPLGPTLYVNVRIDPSSNPPRCGNHEVLDSCGVDL